MTQIFLHLIIISVTWILMLLRADQHFFVFFKNLKLKKLQNTFYRKLCLLEISSSSLISGSLHFSIPILWLLLLHKRERRSGCKGLLLLSGLMLFTPVEVKYKRTNTRASNLISFFCQLPKLNIYLKFTSVFKKFKLHPLQWNFSIVNCLQMYLHCKICP